MREKLGFLFERKKFGMPNSDDFKYTKDLFTPAKKMIGRIDTPILYIGMEYAWHHPMLICDAAEIDCVDPFYARINLLPSPFAFLERFIRKNKDSITQGEPPFMLSYLLNGMKNCLGVVPRWQNDGSATNIELKTNEGRLINWRLIAENIESYFQKEGQKSQYPLIMLIRTFPSCLTWVEILEHLEDRGWLLSTGFGHERGQDPYLTVEGVPNSSFPLFFPSEVVGLKTYLSRAEYLLQQKFAQVAPEFIQDLLFTECQLSAVIDFSAWAIIESVEKRDQNGEIVSFYASSFEKLPVLWSEQALQNRIGAILQRLPSVIISEQKLQALDAMKKRVMLLQETSRSSVRLSEPYWQTAGYLENGETIDNLFSDYYVRLLEAIKKIKV